MFHAAKRSADHCIGEGMGGIECRYPDGERLPYAKMARPPCDLLPGANQPGGHARHSPLACLSGGLDMQIDAPGEIENPFDGRFDR